MIAFTKTAAKELARNNITVNAVCPGFIATDMVTSLTEDIQDSIRSQIPLGRFGEPEEVAARGALPLHRGRLVHRLPAQPQRRPIHVRSLPRRGVRGAGAAEDGARALRRRRGRSRDGGCGGAGAAEDGARLGEAPRRGCCWRSGSSEGEMVGAAITPAGLEVALTRHRIRDGQSAEADRWMPMLNDRREECIATLAA